MQYRPVSEGAPTGSALPLRDEVIEGIQQKKRFTGQAREYRLAVLASLVNDHHNLAHEALQNYLDNVYFAGEALEEAKRLLSGRRKWGRWLEANFPKSGETSRVYRRVYREWNDPRFVEARASDAPPRTLNAVLRVLRGQPIERHFEQDELDADQINRKQV
ncbi:hypothetical protein [Lacipirellula parvula]|nr:hypothetical protein [Lacipirellula parvula]